MEYKYNKSSFFILLALMYGLAIACNCPPLDSFIWIFTVFTVYVFIKNFTHKINFLDVTAMAACISYLLMPLLSYNIFGEHNKMAALWQTYMVIDKEDYFKFALPGTISLLIGLWFPKTFNIPLNDVQLVENIRTYLKTRKSIGYILIIIGLTAVPFVEWAPQSVKAIFYFISQLTYVGAIYLLFSGIRFKRMAIAVMLTLMIIQSIITGMYGELFYWSIMGSILTMINNRSLTMVRSLALISLGIIFVFLIQSIKHEYREAVWKGDKRGNDPALFLSLLVDRVKDPISIFAPERIFKVVVRANQGFLIGRAMDYVPKHEPYANGETIIESFASAFVPRFLWLDKPRVGGHDKICRFLGDCNQLNYSYNIGQLGEAYVNFGRVGGIIYMFFYGLMLKTLFDLFRYLSLKRPTLLLWTPILFFPAMVVETDLLTFINTFVKGAMFCAFSFFMIRLLFKIKL